MANEAINKTKRGDSPPPRTRFSPPPLSPSSTSLALSPQGCELLATRGWSHTVSMQMVEIYNESLVDLLRESGAAVAAVGIRHGDQVSSLLLP